MTTTLVTIAALYALVFLAVFLLQDRLLFPAAGIGRGRPVDAVPGVVVEWLELDGGERVRAAVARVAGAEAVLLCFGGNGQDLRSGIYEASSWARYGHHAVFVEFPGYGDSEGEPSLASLLAAAHAGAERAHALARDGGEDLPVVAIGNSLGTFCATALAAEGLVERVLLRAPPSSIAAVGQSHYPLLPIGLLLRHDISSIALAPRVTVPVLIFHGDRDRTVPLRFGQQLADAFGGPAELVVVPGRGHNDLPYERGSEFTERIARFLAEGV